MCDDIYDIILGEDQDRVETLGKKLGIFGHLNIRSYETSPIRDVKC